MTGSIFDRCGCGEREAEKERQRMAIAERVKLAARMLGFEWDQVYSCWDAKCESCGERVTISSRGGLNEHQGALNPKCKGFPLVRETISQVVNAESDDEVRQIVAAAFKSVGPKGEKRNAP